MVLSMSESVERYVWSAVGETLACCTGETTNLYIAKYFADKIFAVGQKSKTAKSAKI